MHEKVLTSTYAHSVRIEPTKLILVGTRITYQATEDAINRGIQSRTVRHEIYQERTFGYF